MKPLLFVSSALVVAFGTILGVIFLQTDQPLALLSEATEFKNVHCPIQGSLYVHEIDANGEEVPLSVDTHPDIDVFKWSVTDTQKPDAQSIFFSALPFMEQTILSESLALVHLPRGIDIYKSGDTASLQLHYQTDLFTIEKQEVSTNTALRNENDQPTNLDTIQNIPMECNMTIQAGWVVKRRVDFTDTAAQSVTDAINCDLNNDKTCNTFDLFIVLDTYGERGKDLEGDLNNDNVVNALDYTLMTSKISLL